jgi:hypothetical protein
MDALGIGVFVWNEPWVQRIVSGLRRARTARQVNVPSCMSLSFCSWKLRGFDIGDCLRLISTKGNLWLVSAASEARICRGVSTCPPQRGPFRLTMCTHTLHINRAIYPAQVTYAAPGTLEGAYQGANIFIRGYAETAFCEVIASRLDQRKLSRILGCDFNEPSSLSRSPDSIFRCIPSFRAAAGADRGGGRARSWVWRRQGPSSLGRHRVPPLAIPSTAAAPRQPSPLAQIGGVPALGDTEGLPLSLRLLPAQGPVHRAVGQAAEVRRVSDQPRSARDRGRNGQRREGHRGRGSDLQRRR